MKLNQQQIEFIDNYLENAGIRHVDIRIEMTDHIASELENVDSDFGESFSRYMIANKDWLLKQNEDFREIARENAYGYIRQCMAHPFAIFVGIVALIGILFLPSYTAPEKLAAQYNIAYCMGVALLFLTIVYYRVFGKYSYSVTDRLLWMALILGGLINSYRIIENYYILLVFFSTGIYMSIVLVMAFYKTLRFYSIKYKMIR